MAAVWITRFINDTDTPITISSTDPTWRPWIGGTRVSVNQPFTVPPRRTSPTFVPLPFFPGGGITIPPGPTTVDASYWFVGWVDFAQTNVSTPTSQLKAVVGPQANGNDYLRMFDPAENELASIEVGPRGPGWVASVDFHVTFDQSAEEVRWNYWNANGIGANILQRIDEQFRQEASNIGKALFALLFA